MILANVLNDKKQWNFIMSTQILIAHVRDKQIHQLQEHLKKVAELAKQFAGSYGAECAYQAGLWHDLGKAQEAFQHYIRQVTGFEQENAHLEQTDNPKTKRIPHSTAGAKHIWEQLNHQQNQDNHQDRIIACILAYLISGHHAGLADWHGKGSLKHRLQQAEHEWQSSLNNAKTHLPHILSTCSESALLGELVAFTSSVPNYSSVIHIWVRFLFSCLVDADFLDTEAFMNGFRDADEAKQQGLRPVYPELVQLWERYQIHMNQLRESSDLDRMVNQCRQKILHNCLEAADLDKRLFSLTVPTGGGKTLASLGFALKHALKFNKKRIIYAIPFTSIIEQNAQVFRRVLGHEVVLEHHSNLDVTPELETTRTRLATQNWDAPLIVTTNVQFFESLFASRTSSCRKIHNIADSVVILDEAQQIPREFQKPITDMMRVLSKYFGVTFVLCTATQPELGKQTNFRGSILMEGLSDVHEIIHDKNHLANQLKRVQIHFPEKNQPKQSWQEIADEILAHHCVLAVVNTRKHAQELFRALPNHVIKLHLSANMCAAHRSEVIALVRMYLAKYHAGELNQAFCLVSTQLIEAGVDLDFPVVYRAMAGLDSIVQAAGRCNREGKLPDGELGQVVVFRPEQGAPSGSLQQGQNITEEMLAMNLLNNPFSPDTFANYFQRFNAKGEVDKHGITSLLTPDDWGNTDNPLDIEFRTAAERFRMIDNQGISVIVPFLPLMQKNKNGHKDVLANRDLNDFIAQKLHDLPIEQWQDEWKNLAHRDDTSPIGDWLKRLEQDPLQNKWVYRKLQRYTITIQENQLKKLPQNAIMQRAGLLVLDNGYYDAIFGAVNADDVILPTCV